MNEDRRNHARDHPYPMDPEAMGGEEEEEQEELELYIGDRLSASSNMIGYRSHSMLNEQPPVSD